MKLNYFKTNEFRGQKRLVSPRLLVMLDVYRFMLDEKVMISPHKAAIGREDGTSQHNYRRYGEVRALDVMPEGIHTLEDAERSVEIARMIGFTGIGFYPHWDLDGNPENGLRPGLHLDVREDRMPTNPSTWGGVKREGKQVYVSIEEALSEMKTETGLSFGI